MTLPTSLGELQLYRLLQRANLLAYYQTFIEQGGDDVSQLCEAGEAEFLEIMVLVGMANKPLHVRRLQKALRDWGSNPGLLSQPLPSLPLASVPLPLPQPQPQPGPRQLKRKSASGQGLESGGGGGSGTGHDPRGDGPPSPSPSLPGANTRLCLQDRTLVMRRVDLYSVCRQAARECAYPHPDHRTHRSSPEGSSPPRDKKLKQEVVSGCEGSESRSPPQEGCGRDRAENSSGQSEGSPGGNTHGNCDFSMNGSHSAVREIHSGTDRVREIKQEPEEED